MGLSIFENPNQNNSQYLSKSPISWVKVCSLMILIQNRTPQNHTQNLLIREDKWNLPWKWEVVSLAWDLHTCSLQQPPTTQMQFQEEITIIKLMIIMLVCVMGIPLAVMMALTFLRHWWGSLALSHPLRLTLWCLSSTPPKSRVKIFQIGIKINHVMMRVSQISTMRY